MPRTHGDALIHQNALDYIIDVDDALPTAPSHAAAEDTVSRRIGEHVAALVEDGSTLQMGIGAIPNAVLGQLTSHRDLGIHTEMVSDGMLELVKRNVITNARKPFFRHHTVSTFVFGSEELYAHIDDNPSVALLRCSDTNDTSIIKTIPQMVAINSAIEVDLSGQVVADSIGDHIHSGVGGQIDFMRGAALSEGGRAIIALPSTVARTGASRLVSALKLGAGVTTTRAHVDYVVTEYGAVSLRGKNLWQRAEDLISIAHPSHRDRLYEEMMARVPHWKNWNKQQQQ